MWCRLSNFNLLFVPYHISGFPSHHVLESLICPNICSISVESAELFPYVICWLMRCLSILPVDIVDIANRCMLEVTLDISYRLG